MPLVKSAYQNNNFRISQPKHMLLVLKRTVLMRRIFCAPKTYAKIDGLEIIYTFNAKKNAYLNLCSFVLGLSIQRLTVINNANHEGQPKTFTEKTAMVRAARKLLSAITKVLLIADKVIVKQLLTSKDKVSYISVLVW